MKFSQVLRETIEQDNGLLLRLAAFEEMLGTREQSPGFFARRRRSFANSVVFTEKLIQQTIRRIFKARIRR